MKFKNVTMVLVEASMKSKNTDKKEEKENKSTGSRNIKRRKVTINAKQRISFDCTYKNFFNRS